MSREVSQQRNIEFLFLLRRDSRHSIQDLAVGDILEVIVSQSERLRGRADTDGP